MQYYLDHHDFSSFFCTRVDFYISELVGQFSQSRYYTTIKRPQQNYKTHASCFSKKHSRAFPLKIFSRKFPDIFKRKHPKALFLLFRSLTLLLFFFCMNLNETFSRSALFISPLDYACLSFCEL